MKRKLVCIFLMIAGAAVLTGTILLSQGRCAYTDATPVYTLIFLSAVTILAAAASMSEPYVYHMSERERTLLRVYRAVNILSILACFAFVVIMFFLTDYDSDFVKPFVILFMLLAAVSILMAALNLKVRPPFTRRDITKAAVAFIIAVMLCFVYLNFMPKYSIVDGVNMIRSDIEFAQKDVYYPTYYMLGEPNGYTSRHADQNDDELVGSNPFYSALFYYYCDSFSYDEDGLHDVKGIILFNTANGAYKYTRQGKVLSFSSGEWPEFNWNFMHDTVGQHSAVLNLYFREWYHEVYSDDVNPMLSVSSDEWDSKLKDVLYPNNFSEDEALSFIKSIAEEELKTKLLEQINELGSEFKDKTVEVYFFGIDIATYQNGEIDLKL